MTAHESRAEQVKAYMRLAVQAARAGDHDAAVTYATTAKRYAALARVAA